MKRILVCEDETSIREFVVINLKRSGYDVLEAGSGEEALALFDQFKQATIREVMKIYDLLGITFDSYNGEAFYNDKMQPVVDELRAKHLLTLSEGAYVVDLSEDNMPPCIILKSDGTTLYATRDLAAAFYRKKTYDFAKCLYVVAYQQNLHFRQWFKVVEKMGYDWAKSTLRVGLFGGEPCPSALKAEIESRMHIVCTDNYGLTEVMGPGVSGECLAERDMQHIAEDHFLWEVVDPATGEPVPEGEMGELVLTPLDKEGIPVLRYRTHDLTRVVTEKCSCGRTHARMQKVRSRCDDMLIIRGTNVFPSQVEDVLAGIEGVTPHYLIVVDNETGLDRMTVNVELKPEAFSDSFEVMDNFRQMVADKLKGTLLVGVKVKLVEPGGIERSVGKTKHVKDLRK